MRVATFTLDCWEQQILCMQSGKMHAFYAIKNQAQHPCQTIQNLTHLIQQNKKMVHSLTMSLIMGPKKVNSQEI